MSMYVVGLLGVHAVMGPAVYHVRIASPVIMRQLIA